MTPTKLQSQGWPGGLDARPTENFNLKLAVGAAEPCTSLVTKSFFSIHFPHSSFSCCLAPMSLCSSFWRNPFLESWLISAFMAASFKSVMVAKGSNHSTPVYNIQCLLRQKRHLRTIWPVMRTLVRGIAISFLYCNSQKQQCFYKFQQNIGR